MFGLLGIRRGKGGRVGWMGLVVVVELWAISVNRSWCRISVISRSQW